MSRDPDTARTRRHHPASVNPNILVSVPALVPIGPDIRATRRDGTMLNNWRRRCYTYDYLGESRARSQQRGSGCRQ